MADSMETSFCQPKGKTELAQEISRVQNLYDDLYADDPDYGNGPGIKCDLKVARRNFDSNDETLIAESLVDLRGITLSA